MIISNIINFISMFLNLMLEEKKKKKKKKKIKSEKWKK